MTNFQKNARHRRPRQSQPSAVATPGIAPTSAMSTAFTIPHWTSVNAVIVQNVRSAGSAGMRTARTTESSVRHIAALSQSQNTTFQRQK